MIVGCLVLSVCLLDVLDCAIASLNASLNIRKSVCVRFLFACSPYTCACVLAYLPTSYPSYMSECLNERCSNISSVVF